MDIFDRLGNLIRTILDDDESGEDDPGRFRDADESAAWEELESYMKSGTATAERGESTRRSFEEAESGIPASLRKDFRNLEVPPGAPLPDVRKAYKRLMAAFHPDRHSSDPERLRTATEITKKLNASFHRIRAYYEEGGA